LRGPISKITKAKWTGGVVQAVEHLLCKLEALSSNPYTAKKIIDHEEQNMAVNVPTPLPPKNNSRCSWPLNELLLMGMGAHTCNPSTWEEEAEGSGV
jgi:hypothetical protein